MEIIKLPIGDRGAELTAYIQAPSREMPQVATKPAMLVLPGGAYLFTSDREAEPIALSYAAEGFQAFVLRYSVGANANGCQPLKEASEAVALIRANATEWFLNPGQVAVCGFSAGGHLAAWVGLAGEARPNAMVLSYPAVQLHNEGDPSSMIVEALLGKDYSAEDAHKLNLAALVDENAPPMFCWSTQEDVLVKAKTVLGIATAYAEAERPFELHIYQEGEHGFSLARPITAAGRLAMVDEQAATWQPLSVEWLWRQFGKLEIEDKEYERPDGLWPDEMARR